MSAYVYILASQRNGTLYTGVTSDLFKRIWEHKNGVYKSFSSKYGVDILVYYEEGDDIEAAIIREKKIKGKSRKYKVTLIEEKNPEWNDLSEDWYK